jgi:hypothetical protein
LLFEKKNNIERDKHCGEDLCPEDAISEWKVGQRDISSYYAQLD